MRVTEERSAFGKSINVGRQHLPFITSEATDPVFHVVNREKQHVWSRLGGVVGVRFGTVFNWGRSAFEHLRVPRNAYYPKKANLESEVVSKRWKVDGHSRSPGILPSPVNSPSKSHARLNRATCEPPFGPPSKCRKMRPSVSVPGRPAAKDE